VPGGAQVVRPGPPEHHQGAVEHELRVRDMALVVSVALPLELSETEDSFEPVIAAPTSSYESIGAARWARACSSPMSLI
jgi:hypothetical protein